MFLLCIMNWLPLCNLLFVYCNFVRLLKEKARNKIYSSFRRRAPLFPSCFSDDSKAIHAVKLTFRKEEGTHLAALMQNVKHLQNICSVCGEHLLSINFPPRNWDGYYAYSSRMGEKLCLLVGIRTLPLLRSRHTNPPSHMPCDIHRFGSW
jgi:hypothetical protein